MKHQYSNHDSHPQQQPNHLNQLKQMEMNVTPSPPPPLLPKKQFYVQRNGGYMKDETDIINEMNQMYMKSPFAQRRCQPSDDGYRNSPSPKMDAIYNNIGALWTRCSDRVKATDRKKFYFPQLTIVHKSTFRDHRTCNGNSLNRKIVFGICNIRRMVLAVRKVPQLLHTLGNGYKQQFQYLIKLNALGR